MFPILFHIGPITLHTYGLMVAVGFLLAFQVARVQFERYGLPKEKLDSFVFLVMASSLLGARFFYFAIEAFPSFVEDPLSFFRVWEGGLVFYGGVIGGVSALVFYALRNKFPVLLLTDALSAPLLLGHAIGRLGCFAAGCCYGRLTDVPWAVVFKSPDSLAPRFTPLHPTQIYESLGNFILFALAMRLSRTLKRGELTAFYLVSYGLFRFVMEYWRDDVRGTFHFGASPSQLIAIGMIAAGIGIFAYAKKERAA